MLRCGWWNKTAEWGSKVVNEFVEYVRVNASHLKGFSRSSIYNMILFYDEYSSPFFQRSIMEIIHYLSPMNLSVAQKHIYVMSSIAIDKNIKMPNVMLRRSRRGMLGTSVMCIMGAL